MLDHPVTGACSSVPLLCLHHCPKTYFRRFYLLTFICPQLLLSQHSDGSLSFPLLCFITAYAVSSVLLYS